MNIQFVIPSLVVSFKMTRSLRWVSFIATAGKVGPFSGGKITHNGKSECYGGIGG